MRDNFSPDSRGRWLALFWVLLMLPFMLSAQVADPNPAEGIQIANPGADLWRAVRQREGAVVGSTQVSAVDSGILINSYGDRWRNFRVKQLVPYGGYLLSAVVLLLVIFYLVRGRINVVGGMSDKKLFRYPLYERMIHWCLAGTFLFLAFTGLILLFGRSLLIPVLGPELFALFASASKEGHNLFGPLFGVALVLVFFRFVRRNIYQKGDLTWLLKGGSMIGKHHVPSNFFNMGEKSMFWMLVFVGGVIVASGLVLIFPMFGQGRVLMELSHIAHGVSVLIMMAVIIGHIYIGSVGMEGALDGMTSGYCDLNWAREHHAQWAERCEAQAEVLTEKEVSRLRGDTDGSRESSGGVQGASQ